MLKNVIQRMLTAEEYIHLVSVNKMIFFSSQFVIVLCHGMGHPRQFKLFTNDKSIDLPTLKAFADDKICVAQNLKFILGRVENIVGKGENAGYQHFLLLPQCFQKASSSGSLKVRIVW